MSRSLDFSKTTYLVITGASRGIGATIALEFAKKLAPKSRILLLARNRTGLEGTQSKILAANPHLEVQLRSVDFSIPQNQDFQKFLAESAPKSYEQGIIVHNAGSTGDVSKRAREASDVAEWQENFTTNVFNVVRLNNAFLEVVKGVRRYIINITSKAAIEPFEGFAFYCPNKAARESYFRVLAAEEKDDQSLVVLNYSPGPVDTQMIRNIGENSIAEGFRTFVVEGLKNGNVLTTDQTTAKLIVVLEMGQYENGAHVDYFDV